MNETTRYKNHSVTLWVDRYGQIQISIDGSRHFGAAGSSLADWQLAEQRAREIVDLQQTK